MVKSVVGEEPQLKTLENRLYQSSVAAQVGIVIGKVSPNSDRGFVYDLIPTPLTDSGSAACSLKSEPASREEKKKGSKGGKPSNDPPPSLLIDGDWVAEHARQVSRMLMGGMNVVGVFLWASESAFKATPPSIISQIKIFFSYMRSRFKITDSCRYRPMVYGIRNRQYQMHHMTILDISVKYRLCWQFVNTTCPKGVAGQMAVKAKGDNLIISLNCSDYVQSNIGTGVDNEEVGDDCMVHLPSTDEAPQGNNEVRKQPDAAGDGVVICD